MNRAQSRPNATSVRIPRTCGDEPCPNRAAAEALCCFLHTRDEPDVFDEALAKYLLVPAHAGMNRRVTSTMRRLRSISRTRGMNRDTEPRSCHRPCMSRTRGDEPAARSEGLSPVW